MQNKKIRYLFQLVYTSVLLVIVPILLFYCIVWNRSYKEVKLLNLEYYNHSLSTFMANYTDAIENFKSNAITFSVNSRDSQWELSVFYHGTPLMEKYAYYYGEAISRLRTYGEKNGYDLLGVYYYDKDVLLIEDGKYTADRYLQNVLQIHQEEKDQDFFSEDKYRYNRILLAPIYDSEGKCEKFLLGMCTILGKEREKAILFCQLGYDDVEMSYFSSSGRQRENYFVIDRENNRLLFSVGATKEEYLFIEQMIADGSLNTVDNVSENGSQKFYIKNHDAMDLTFLVDITGDLVQNRISGLHTSVKFFFVYIILIMLIVDAGMIFYNYRPVNRLLNKIQVDSKYEFDAILHVWTQQNEMLTEQRMLIMDLLMNQLLYGVPISPKNVEKLGLSNNITCYCVYVVENYVLRVSEMDEVIQTAEETFGTLVFATDITGKNSTVLIAFMETDQSEQLGSWIESWIKKHIKESCAFKKGIVVHEMNNIQKSFDRCLEKDPADLQNAFINPEDHSSKKTVLDEVNYRAVLNNKLKEKVLAYMEEHFVDSEISQQQLADHFQISVYTLSKMFNNQIGIGFSEYLNSKRIEYAKKLLCSTGIPVKKIAVMVGIPNDNYFSKIFKRYEGCSPLAYRERNYK